MNALTEVKTGCFGNMQEEHLILAKEARETSCRRKLPNAVVQD